MTHLVELDLSDRAGRTIVFICDTDKKTITGAWVEERPRLISVTADPAKQLDGNELYDLFAQYMGFTEK